MLSRSQSAPGGIAVVLNTWQPVMRWSRPQAMFRLGVKKKTPASDTV
jgi:hypothetical protein